MNMNELLSASPQILDCTLRDGSYEIDFQFSSNDTAVLCKKLEKANIKVIEVGHGVGLGASESGYGNAAATDEEYMKAAASNVKESAWGMFCIPGIATLDHISMLADYGASFVRIGTNVEDYHSSEKFIKFARQKGLFICSNFMKSYTSSYSDFARIAQYTTDYGSDLIYIVDSAGGMLPSEVQGYAEAVWALNKEIKLGFHGHNNLGLAVANSLLSYNLGFSLIDTSISGLGRSAGNAPTEQLISAIVRSKGDIKIDPIDILDIYEDEIKCFSETNIDTLETVSGLALFHSSYLSIIEKYSKIYRVDPRRLIIDLCTINRTEAPEDLVEKLAKKISEKYSSRAWRRYYKSSDINEQK